MFGSSSGRHAVTRHVILVLSRAENSPAVTGSHCQPLVSQIGDICVLKTAVGIVSAQPSASLPQADLGVECVPSAASPSIYGTISIGCHGHTSQRVHGMAYTSFVTRHRPPKAFFIHFFARASPEMVSDLPFWADF
jgi:hypothetical protein